MQDDTAGTAEPPEQTVARQLRQLRIARGWSQQDVADRMRAYGNGYDKWRQSTVGKIEAGQRPLRVNELVHLATLFELGPGNLLLPGGIPHGYPHHQGIPDDLLTLEQVQGELTALKTVSENGEHKLAELWAVLAEAARNHRFAQMEYDTARHAVDAARGRIAWLLGRRDELLAGGG